MKTKITGLELQNLIAEALQEETEVDAIDIGAELKEIIKEVLTGKSILAETLIENDI